MRYLTSMMNTVKRKWFLFLLITVAFTAALAGFGAVKAKKDIAGEAEKQEEIAAYLEQVEKYETAISDSREAVRLAEEQRAELQDYVDNAVYMKLDSDNIYVGSVQYTVVPAEGTNTGNVLNALNLYVTQGGLKEDAEGHEEELGVKYWSEVIGTAIAGQTFSVTIMEPTEKLAADAIEVIKDCLRKDVAKVAESHGSFELVEQDTSVYTKSEAGILNNQNARRNDLKNYQTNHSDLETRVFNQQNTLDTYIENNKPDSLEVKKTSVSKNVKLFGVIGLIAGLWIALGLILIDYIAGNRVKSEDDLKKFGLEILGMHTRKKGFVPDVEKTAVEIQSLLTGLEKISPSGTPGKDSVALYDLARSEDTNKTCEEYLGALKEVGCSASYVDAAGSGASSLTELLSCGSVVIVAPAGDTRIEKVEEALRKLNHYGICCLGAIVLK